LLPNQLIGPNNIDKNKERGYLQLFLWHMHRYSKKSLKIFDAFGLLTRRPLNKLCRRIVSPLSLLQRTTESDVNINISTRDGGSIFHLELY